MLLLATGRISRETVELLRRARHDADHDALTGVLAPRAFRAQVDRLSDLASEERPVALIALDLDGMGAVNKRLGHGAGDRLLVQTARTIRDQLREGDVLGRLGGDEFAAVVASDDAHRVARRLIEAVGSQEGGECSACAGVAPLRTTASAPRRCSLPRTWRCAWPSDPARARPASTRECRSRTAPTAPAPRSSASAAATASGWPRSRSWT